MANSLWCAETNDLLTFIEKARPCEIFIYYTGNSLSDSILSKEMGKLTFKLSQAGKGYLVQKRYKAFYYFDFFFIKASKNPVPSLVPFSDEKFRTKHQIDRGAHMYHGQN